MSIGNKFSAGNGSLSKSSISGASGVTTISFEYLSSNTIPSTSCKLLWFSRACTRFNMMYSPSPLITISIFSSSKVSIKLNVGWYPPITTIVSGRVSLTTCAVSSALPIVGVSAVRATKSGFLLSSSFSTSLKSISSAEASSISTSTLFSCSTPAMYAIPNGGAITPINLYLEAVCGGLTNKTFIIYSSII